MFGNIYRKYIIRAVRSQDMVIWTFLFPILLATLFHFALSSLEEENSFETVPVAMVQDQELDQAVYLKQMMESLSEGETPVIKISWAADDEEAEELLKEEQVKGYIAVEKGVPKLYVRENGISETILKNVLDRYIQTKDTVMTMIRENPKAALALADSAAKGDSFGEMWGSSETFIQDLKLSSQKPSATANYYYALLAMLCMFGGFHGLVVVESLQANLSPQGARNTLSPGNRYKLFCASYLGALTIQFFSTAVSLCYIQFVLKVSFGAQFGYALAAGFVGSMAGIAFGSLVALPSKWKGGIKTGILIGVSLICCFFAGLMIGGINYLVEEHLPVLAMVNPAARISDAFYCLYYYEDHARYFQNIGILLAMSLVFTGICVVFIRRDQYESI